MRNVRGLIFAVTMAGFILGALAVPAAGQDDPKAAKGKVTHVTLYRGQALVTRQVAIKGAKGAIEIVVSALPNQIVASSLFAESDATIEVRAVRYRSRAVGEEPRAEVRKIDVSIEELSDKIAANRSGLELLAKRSQYLDKLEGFVAITAKADLAKGTLNAESLEKISTFSFKERDSVAKQMLQMKKDSRDLTRQLSVLQRQRATLAQSGSRTIHEAVLFLQKQNDADGTVRLSYLVNGCGWSPAYNFRAKADGDAVRVEYNALVQQMTGEDWSDVTLALSTASPALSAEGPGLAPLQVVLTKTPKQVADQGIPSQQLALRSILRRQELGQMANAKALNLDDNRDSAWAINRAAGDLQVLELNDRSNTLRTVRMGQVGGNLGPSLNYNLAGTISLQSRSDQQMIRIIQADLKSQFYYVATPVLSSFVYREAEMKNSSGQDLLGGPVSVYLDDRFVGRGEIETVARGQTFVLGFGADPQLRTSRELLERKEDIQGANRVQSFSYRLVIENYKDAQVTVRLEDRLPHSRRQSDIRITLSELKDPLSEDALYMRMERSKGILRWEIKVPAHASGEKARMVDYSYNAEFDSSLTLSAPSQVQALQLQQDFYQLEMLRQRH